MNIYLDKLLHLPSATVESFEEVDQVIYFKIDLLNEGTNCRQCQNKIAEIHQIEYSLIRDLPVFGRSVYLKVPRRQFYCQDCQKYSTERLEFIDWRRRHTRRYEESVYEKVKPSNIEQVSREEGLSREVVQSIFNHLGKSLKKKIGNSLVESE